MSVEAAAMSHRHAFAGVPFTRLLGMRRNFSEGGRAQLVNQKQAAMRHFETGSVRIGDRRFSGNEEWSRRLPATAGGNRPGSTSLIRPFTSGSSTFNAATASWMLSSVGCSASLRAIVSILAARSIE